MNAWKRIAAAVTAPFSGLRPAPAPCPDLEPRVSPPAVLALDQRLSATSFCMPSSRMETLLREGSFQILHAKRCASGVAGAQLVYLDFPDEALVVKAKWKEAKHGGTGLNNEPRKEQAAYEVQKWFLDPEEHVVPPSVCRAVPLAHYREAIHDTKPTFDGTDCAFGLFAFWCDNVEEMRPFEPGRFEADAAYRATLANMNLLTYLIDHRDTRPANFVFSTDPARPRALSIDNGLAFSGLCNPRVFFTHEWRSLMVPSLPHEKIERLRAVTRSDVERLAVISQHEIEEGQLREVARGAVVGRASEGVRREGDTIQLGLTTDELEGVYTRVRTLLADVDAGRIALH